MIALALAHAGFWALSLAMERHHEEVFATRRIPPRRALALRLAGWGLLALSAPAAFAAAGAVTGAILWCGVLTAAALPCALLLAYAPRLGAGLAPILLGLAVLI